MNKEINPQVYARVGGLLYVIMIVLGIIQEGVIRSRVIVAANAAATFANLQTMEGLWRAGIAIHLLMDVITIVLALVLYVLTRPVHKELALLALLFNVIATGAGSASVIQLVDAVLPLGKDAYLNAFTPGQLQAMTALAMEEHVFGFGIALLLFGPFFLITGYLIFRSGYFPKSLGVLYQLPGLGYMCNTFALVLAPGIARHVLMIIAAPTFIGELSLALWLLIKGVRIEKWRSVVSEELT